MNRDLKVGFLKAKHIAISIAVFIIANIVLGVVAIGLAKITGVDQINMILLLSGLASLCAIIYLNYVQRNSSEYKIISTKTGGINIFLVLVGVVVMFMASIVMMPYLEIVPQSYIEQYESMFKGSSLLVTIFAGVIVAPIVEEILFRRFMLRGLMGRVSQIWAIVIVSLIFALVHLSIVQSPSAFVLSVIISIVYTISGFSLATAIALHMINNFIAVGSLYAIPDTLESYSEITKALGLNPSVVYVVALCVLLIFLVYGFNTIFKQNKGQIIK